VYLLAIGEVCCGYIAELCKKSGISKYRLSQLSGISQFSLGRIIATESLPSLITLEKICAALDVTLSQFFCEEDMKDMAETQTEVLEIWKDLSADEQEVVLAMLRGLKK
jgi:transcriptional regulator with XRE-family HTH domain